MEDKFISKENINQIVSFKKHIYSMLSCLCHRLEASSAIILRFIEEKEISLFALYGSEREISLEAIENQIFSPPFREKWQEKEIIPVNSSSDKTTVPFSSYLLRNKLQSSFFLPLHTGTCLWGWAVFLFSGKKKISEEELELFKDFKEMITTVLYCNSSIDGLKEEAKKLENKIAILKKLKALEDPFTRGELALTMVELALRETGTGIAIIDEKMNLRYLNKSWMEKYGDYREKKCHDYFMGFSEVCSNCGVMETLKIGQVNVSEEFLLKHGRLYEVIRTPFEEATGEKFVAEIYLDVTERRIVEEKAFTLSSIIEQSPSIILLTDTEGKIDYVNPKFTEITGYTREEVIGKNPSILKSGEMSPDEYKALWETVKAGNEWRGEFHNKKKNGEFFWEYASISPLRNSKGEITHYLAIKEDITERKKMEAELQRAREIAESAAQVKSQFLANMSHELRTPMNSILGISGILAKKNSENLTDKQLKGLNMINQSGQRLLDLIDDILDLARLEAKKAETTMEEFVLKDLLSEVDGFSRGILKENISFSIKKKEALPVTLLSDRKKIIQILTNLISNAIKFTHEGKIELEIYKEAENINFSVKDTGIGISAEHMDLIFQRFKQVDGSHSRNYKGTGLGLSISRELAQLLKGKIFVESEPGVGSTFTLSIPYKRSLQGEG